MITEANIKSITVMVMEVPCCSGLVGLAKQALDISKSNLKFKAVVVGINGEVLKEILIN